MMDIADTASCITRARPVRCGALGSLSVILGKLNASPKSKYRLPAFELCPKRRFRATSNNVYFFGGPRESHPPSFSYYVGHTHRRQPRVSWESKPFLQGIALLTAASKSLAPSSPKISCIWRYGSSPPCCWSSWCTLMDKKALFANTPAPSSDICRTSTEWV